MHYYRRDGVWNGAGHQSRAPFEEMMHWFKMQAHITGCRALAINDPRISNNILPWVDKMRCSTHKYGWDEKWIGQNRGDTSGTEKDLLSWRSVMVILVGAAVLRLHYDVCVHKSLCQGCFCSPSNIKLRCFSIYPCLCPTLLLLIEGTDLGWGANVQVPLCTLWNVILFILTPMPGECICSKQKCGQVLALLQLQSISHVIKKNKYYKDS